MIELNLNKYPVLSGICGTSLINDLAGALYVGAGLVWKVKKNCASRYLIKIIQQNVVRPSSNFV